MIYNKESAEGYETIGYVGKGTRTMPHPHRLLRCNKTGKTGMKQNKRGGKSRNGD